MFESIKTRRGFAAGAAIVGLLLVTRIGNGAEIKTVPEQMHPQQPSPVWVADGTTEYTLYIHVDNTGLNGQPTRAAQWGLTGINGLQYVEGSSAAPDINDFFVNYPTEDDWLFPPSGVSSRIVAIPLTGPSDYQGYVGMYKFKVPTNTAPGTYHFDLTFDTRIYDIYYNRQPRILTYEPVWIAPINPADFNNPPEISRDGYINGEDSQFFMINMSGPGHASAADIDGDGFADMKDLARLQRCFTGPGPVTSETCD